ncbi:cell filamentation protein Fic [Rathayibacter sp. VKM Ac-2754]|nr:cell filamentation protein Fic [Rathayibacter sp. VKM Ac-2754]
MTKLTVVDLAGVVYSSGKVFDGLQAGRLDTERFLRSGSLDGITSRSDLALLEDLRDVAQFVIDSTGAAIDAAYVRAVNAAITRSGPLYPGRFRTADQGIGVNTIHGPHEPRPVTQDDMERILRNATCGVDPKENALDLFVELAKAQPFEDGNKRTALFVANGLLLNEGRDVLLTVPVDEKDPSVARNFNDLLARAYIFDDHTPIKDLLRKKGFAPLRP